MKHLLGIFLMLCVTPAMAALQKHDLLAEETLWANAQNLEVSVEPLSGNSRYLDVRFESDYSRTLIERGDLSLSRKILMNAGGAKMDPTAFQFDLHLELSYKFI